jgi:competence protein ComEC
MLLLYLSAAFICGLATASFVHLPIMLWAWWLALPAIALFIWRRDPFLRGADLCLLFFLFGAIRITAASNPPDEQSLASLNDRGPLSIIGQVVDPPDVRDRSTYLRVSVQRAQVEENWRDLSGMALVEVPRETDVRYGDVIQVHGAPTTPFETEEFSYKDYLARQGIYSLVRTADDVSVLERGGGNVFYVLLYALRDRAFRTIQRIFPEPSASLLSGILLGMDSGIPRDLHDAFATTNTLHIIAISGFNISIIAGVLLKLARRVLSVSAATFVVIGGLAVYTLLVGANASVVRAAIMGSLSLLALYYHRHNDALNALGVSAFLMCLVDPWTLYDLGFQLSFLATLGLVLYGEALARWFETQVERILPKSGHPPDEVQVSSQKTMRLKQIVGAVSDSLIVTLAAQITTTPLILFTFHRLSTVGLLTNLLILPAQPPLMILGGIATIGGMLFQPLGQMVAWVAWSFLEWTIVIVQTTAALPLASIETGRLDVMLIFLWYAILFVAPRIASRGMRDRFALTPALALGGSLVMAMLIWNGYATAPDGRTRLVFIDTPSAATFVQTPAGNKILIDGGANPSALLSATAQRMPFWDRQIDLLVLTNSDDTFLLGLIEILARYDVKEIIQAKEPQKLTAAFLRWRDLIATKRVPVLRAQTGLNLTLDRDVTFEIVPAMDEGESRTAIARLSAGRTTLLFVEGLNLEDQKALVKNHVDIESTVLIAPKLITREFFEGVNPQISIVFAGQSAREKPSADLLTALSRSTILDTATHGTIEMIIDGQTVTVKTMR